MPLAATNAQPVPPTADSDGSPAPNVQLALPAELLEGLTLQGKLPPHLKLCAFH